jgi:hypothetical protein
MTHSSQLIAPLIRKRVAAIASIAGLSAFGVPSNSTSADAGSSNPRNFFDQHGAPAQQSNPPNPPNPQISPSQPGSGNRPGTNNPPNAGAVGPAGGTLQTLSFAVVGATLPPVADDTASYPTTIISAIWRDVQDFSPRPAFAVTTGEYMFANPNHRPSQAAPQLDLYLRARANYQGTVFPVMSGHECTSALESNCGDGNANGVTSNYSAYLAKLLQPIAKQSPYYAVRVSSTSKLWTAKFVFIACNAWDAKQAKWLVEELRQPTTYTFIVRNEPMRTAERAPCLIGNGWMNADATIGEHPYTLLITGHTHTASRVLANKEIIVGNGGAPLASGSYGYAIVQQMPNSNVGVSFYDVNNVLDQHFVVDPSGSPVH